MESEGKARNVVATTAEKVAQQEWLQSKYALRLRNATLTSLQTWVLRHSLTPCAAAYLCLYPPHIDLPVIFYDASTALAVLLAVDLGRYMTTFWPRLESSLAHQNRIFRQVTNFVGQEWNRHRGRAWCTQAGQENTCTEAEADFFLEFGKEEEIERWRRNTRVVRAMKERYLLLKEYIESEVEALADEVGWARGDRAPWDLLHEATTQLGCMARVDGHGDDMGIWSGWSLKPVW